MCERIFIGTKGDTRNWSCCHVANEGVTSSCHDVKGSCIHVAMSRFMLSCCDAQVHIIENGTFYFLLFFNFDASKNVFSLPPRALLLHATLYYAFLLPNFGPNYTS